MAYIGLQSQDLRDCVLISGGTSGIGLEFAKLFATDGYRVVIIGRNTEKLQAATKELADLSGEAPLGIAQDLSLPNAVPNIAHALQKAGLTVDVLINDAGFGYDCRFVDSNTQKQDTLEAVDVTIIRKLMHEFLPGMVERKHGAVLNVASMAGFMAGPFMATYYASKAYVASLTQSIHLELRTSGVAVTALCPGPVRTQFWNKAQAGHTALAYLTLTPQTVARSGYRALAHNRMLCIPGLLPKLGVFITRLVPRSWMGLGAALLQYPGRKATSQTDSSSTK